MKIGFDVENQLYNDKLHIVKPGSVSIHLERSIVAKSKDWPVLIKQGKYFDTSMIYHEKLQE